MVAAHGFALWSCSVILAISSTKADGAAKGLSLRHSKRQEAEPAERESPVADLLQSSEMDAPNYHNPQKWGPAAWFFLHTVALAQIDPISLEQQARLRRFFTEDLPYILPCPVCGEHARSHIQSQQPISDEVFASRTALVKWVNDFHNTVNVQNGKPVVSLARSLENYQMAYSPGVSGPTLFFPSSAESMKSQVILKDGSAIEGASESTISLTA
mmetsp:Transcript_60606/g.131367  ORF Transcript_60606/g.131367 Transcript_60606/m.131367 type:complete len:214 (-) Transcript_60606:43-684(-)